MVIGENKGRFSFGRKMLSTKSGSLYYGKDLSLRRDVLLYRLPDNDKDSLECLARLSGNTQIADLQFLHMLDMGYDELGSYAVIERRKGQLLNEYLSQQPFPIWDALKLVHQLGIGMQEAQEENIRGFSLSANNLWYSEDHPLLVINYWSQGPKEQTGALGLFHLLIQLITASNTVPQEFETMEKQLRRAMQGIPEQTKDALMRLFKQAHSEQYKLTTFLLDLGMILTEKQGTSRHPSIAAPEKRKEALPVSKKEEPSRMVKSSKNKKILAYVAVAVLLFISTFALVRHILQIPSAASPAPAATPVKASPNAQTKPSQDQEKQQVEISSIETASTPPPVAGTGIVTVPDLSGLTREGAEKQALAVGIHYKFVIEPSTQPAGTVFKQDLTAGSQVPKESTITFWVSKGN